MKHIKAAKVRVPSNLSGEIGKLGITIMCENMAGDPVLIDIKWILEQENDRGTEDEESVAKTIIFWILPRSLRGGEILIFFGCSDDHNLLNAPSP